VRTGRTGDELVQVTVETPTNLNARQEELLREFAQTENRNVSPKSKNFFERLKRHLGS
jgi:molecular chaperone DnaJ